MQRVGETIEFVGRAHRNGVAELGRETCERHTTEAVSVALHDRDETIDGVDDAGDVAAPERSSHGQADRHRTDGTGPRGIRRAGYLTVLIGFVSDIVGNMRQLFSFPDPVNETSARLVAGFVVLEAIAFVVFREGWILVPLTYGFLARVATGPTLSPLGQFVTRVATPRAEAWLRRRNPAFHSRQVPGPPKRFAQAIGLVVTAAASIAWLLDAPLLAGALVAVLAVAATLESVFAVCLGCIAYSALWGCADCDDISDRLRQALVEARREAEQPVGATH